ncbi:MAG: molecular chaperone Hsp33 [Candidatus Azotimanducaceae bacterium]|jgi:molecular chaperone Hsp33|tara:strand:- start:260 stop:1261 length:1002 start_codon:yes stop_codon:yes gene_type:complete
MQAVRTSNNFSAALPNMDVLHRFSFIDLPIRGQWVRLEKSLANATAFRVYPKPIHEMLGQMLAAVAMVADNIKFSGAVTLQSRGDGDLLRSLAECQSQSFLRGIMHLQDPDNEAIDEQPLAQWLGNGQLALSLIPDKASGMQPYQGFVSLEYDTLAQCLEHYFVTSEQLETCLHFASSASTSSPSVTGLLLQRLPNSPQATEIEIDAATQAWHTLTTLAATATDEELSLLDPQTLLYRLFNEHPCRLHEPRDLSYRCSCSREKTDTTLMMLGGDDLAALIAEQSEITVDCEFCGNRYSYDKTGVSKVLADLAEQTAAAASEATDTPDQPKTLH